MTIFLITLSIFISIITLFVINIHSFLAYNYPIKADILVVEGWMTDEALKGALAEFKKGNYQLLITTGQTLRRGFYLAEYKTFAKLAEATLLTLGMERDKLIAISSTKINKDRTFNTVKTLSEWLLECNLKIEAINIYSEDVHTRRSWLLLKKVLDTDIKVGAIAFNTLEYDPQKWWLYSEGVKKVFLETISYIYALAFTIFNKI